jgi:hypothetical protein
MKGEDAVADTAAEVLLLRIRIAQIDMTNAK